MSNKKDILPDTKFNYLTVIKENIPRISKSREYVCRCDCGQIVIVQPYPLKNNLKKSCGCHRVRQLTNQRFGYLVVIKFHDRNSKNKCRWLCKCDCGNESIVIGENLISGTSKSCGCYIKISKSQRAIKNLKNKVFGGLTVIERATTTIGKNGECIKWCCSCVCGNDTIVQSSSLISGNTTSCGKCYVTKDKRDKAYKRSQIDRDNGEYKMWRKEVYQRDNYNCLLCNKKGKLNAHHLNGWHWAVDERYLKDNGVTLCAGPNSCHEKFHHIYGRKNNTKEQFIEFLELYFELRTYDVF